MHKHACNIAYANVEHAKAEELLNGLSYGFEWLQHELLEHNDTVVLRGQEEYARLPSKTFGLMRYVAALPSG